MVVVDDDLGRWVGAEGLAQLRPRLGTLVVLSAFDSPTVQTADVVLPVATVGEREGSVVGQDGRVWWLEAVADAPGEARPVVQALADLSEQMGGEATGPELDKVWQVMTAEVMECSRLDLQSLRAGEPGMVHHGVLTQPTGSPDPANQPHEPLGRAEGREWVLVSRRDENSWAFDPRMRAANLLERDLRRTRAPYVYLNADDIGKLQTRAGRKVEVSTVFGTAEVEIRALEGVPPGVVVLPQQFADTRRTLMGGGEVVAPGGRWWRPVWAAVRASR
jgi:anaerobic selenocysteine-containing dehydrogenase